LAELLKPFAADSGPVCPYVNTSKEFQKVAKNTATKKAAAVKWKHNAMRHSFISYRLAIVQDAAKVALEAGNSPQVIFSSYRELVTPDQAKAWFSI
jgi:hypothetical protein